MMRSVILVVNSLGNDHLVNLCSWVNVVRIYFINKKYLGGILNKTTRFIASVIALTAVGLIATACDTIQESVTSAKDRETDKGGLKFSKHKPSDISGGYFHTYDAFKVAGENDQPRKIHVFLPIDYDSNDARYPVIYMNDGGTAFWPETDVGKTWDTARVISDLYASGEMKKVIVVALFPVNRDREYTHDKVIYRDYGGLGEYSRYLGQYVKPWIDANYRTNPEASNSMVMGSSHGGLAAFYTAATQPTLFGMAACLSPSFWVGLDSNPLRLGAFGDLRKSRLIQEAKDGLGRPDHPRIYLDWGMIRTGGFHNKWIEDNATQRGRDMATILRQDYGYVEGQDLFIVEDPQGEHEELTWRRRLPNILKIFFHPH